VVWFRSGHCKKLHPEFESAATTLAEESIYLGNVDATENQALAQKFGVQGYPTIFLFKNGEKSQDYGGGRTAADLVAFMRKKAGPAFVTVNSMDELQKVIDNQKYGVVVGYFSDQSSGAFADFEARADSDMTLTYAVFASAESAADCMPSEGAVAEGTIAVFAKDGSKTVYNGEGSVDAFVSANAFPVAMDLDPALFPTFMEAGNVVVAAFDYSADNAEELRAGFLEAASLGHQKMLFLADSKQWGQAFSRMGASGEKFPTAIAFAKGAEVQQVAYDEDKDFNMGEFSQWLADVAAGTAVSWKKSEDVPESNNGPVTVVVAKNFDEIVYGGSNVLLEFYAPWCGHCKALAPIYEELGEHFADDDSVTIAKIDATANFIDPSFGVRGFPTIKFFAAGSKTPTDYDGAREKDAFIEFITANRK